MDKSQTRRRRRRAILMLGALLGGCALLPNAPPPACPPGVSSPGVQTPGVAAPGAPPEAETAPAKPGRPVRWADLPGWDSDDFIAAWPAFLQSCRGFAAKPLGPAWNAACEHAKTVPAADARAIRRFFESRFAAYPLIAPDGASRGLVTGYYEPLLRGSRVRTEEFAQPVFGPPPDLLTVELAEVQPDLKDKRLRGRLDGRRVVPYYSRAEIAGRDWAARHPETVLLWVDDAIDLFFLQIQGSGRVKLPDGAMARLSYADHNGHPYRSIGRALAERGELPIERASMQGIKDWARAHPARLTELLNQNPAYVFFRELPPGDAAEGPPGALGVPLTAGRSIAVDPRHVPLGAPVYLATTEPLSKTPLARLVMAQDTGAAIRGAPRADYFWGFGEEAGEKAGRMKQQGEMWVLRPVE
ncbi:MAG: murein transglycosylase A [Candidatus Accumulibacter sp.]|jgi:membrane-bound lytic murein transglycosylase A|nr:murein transglycosylase A [Accumulibacter sp.]